jgi:hypothetical protein
MRERKGSTSWLEATGGRRRAFQRAAKWEALGGELQVEVTTLAAQLKRAIAAGEVGRGGGRRTPSGGWLPWRPGPPSRVTVSGADCVDWLVDAMGGSARDDAVGVAAMMLAGNLVRCDADNADFEDTRNSR